MKMTTVKFLDNDGKSQTLEMDREVIDVTNAFPALNPKWSGKCENGHSAQYSTLRRVIDKEWTWYCHDCNEEHDSVEDHFECPTCGVHVEPGEVPAGEVQSIPGMTTYRLNGEIISQEEAEKLIEELSEQQEPTAPLQPLPYVGLSEIAKILKVRRQRAALIVSKPDFPAPAGTVQGKRVWNQFEVEQWITSWPRKSGRPKGK